MKKLIYVLILVLIANISYSNSNEKKSNSSTINSNALEKSDDYYFFSPVRIKIDFSTRSKPLDGACEGSRGICIIIGIDRNDGGDAPQGYTGTGEIYLTPDKKLVLNIIRDDAPESDDPYTFYVYEDIRLNNEICDVLGVNECVIKKGNYKISYSEYELGTIILNTSVR